MSYLTMAILFQVIFAQTYKYAVENSYDGDVVNTFGYISSASILGGYLLIGRPSFSLRAIMLGTIEGVTIFLALLAYFRAVQHGSMSISWMIVGLSFVIPTLASTFLWGEVPSLIQTVGITLLFISLVTVANVEMSHLSRPWVWFAWVGLTFVTSGIGGMIFKLFEEQEKSIHRPLFQLSMYACALLLNGLWSVRGGRLPTRGEICLGTVRGLSSVVANSIYLAAIHSLAGFLVFPIYNAAGIVLNIMASAKLWGERISARSALGILLAVAGIACLGYG